MDLRVTRRALVDDLGLGEELLQVPLKNFSDEHQVLAAFVERRSQNPVGDETTQLPRSKQIVFNLHVGRHRGLTWHDEEDDVVWLLACGYHESGAIDDAYAVFKALDRKGKLLPTAADYEVLTRWRIEQGVSDLPALVELVATEGPELLAASLASPGRTLEVTYANALTVKLVTEENSDSDVVIRTYRLTFQMPPLRAGVVPSGKDWQLLLLFSFLPDSADVSDLEWRADAEGDTVVYREIESS